MNQEEAQKRVLVVSGKKSSNEEEVVDKGSSSTLCPTMEPKVEQHQFCETGRYLEPNKQRRDRVRKKGERAMYEEWPTEQKQYIWVKIREEGMEKSRTRHSTRQRGVPTGRGR